MLRRMVRSEASIEFSWLAELQEVNAMHSAAACSVRIVIVAQQHITWFWCMPVIVPGSTEELAICAQADCGALSGGRWCP